MWQELSLRIQMSCIIKRNDRKNLRAPLKMAVLFFVVFIVE